jgi:hypothetical protein
MTYHDRSHFFKYVTMDGLGHIMSRLSRRWTSPLAFNDPFDTQFDCGFPFIFEDFGHAFLDATEEIVFGDAEPEGDPIHPLFKQLTIARRGRPRRSREEFRSFFQPTVADCIPNLHQSQRLASQIWAQYLASLRILCLTETNENLLMWAHYAHDHTGAVVRFRCVSERDSVLLAALPVNYTTQAPYIGTQEEWIRHLTGQQEIDYDAHFRKLVTTKSQHWAYEKEWRVINFAPRGQEGPYMHDTFWPEEIEAVYFGCRSAPSERQKILDSVHPDLGHVEFHQAKKRQWEFGLEFEKLT